MTNDERKALVRRYIEEVINQRNGERIVELVAPRAACGLRDAALMAQIFSAIPDLRIEISSLYAEGDRVAYQGEWRGTQIGGLLGRPATGRPIVAPAAGLFRVADGRIAEAFGGSSLSSLLAALGAGGGLASEPLLALDQIQGNIVPGFSKDFQILLFFRIEDVAAARRFLAGVAPRLATGAEVLAFNRLFKAARARRGREDGAIRATWINVAFAFRGLRKLSPEAERFGGAFREDIAARVAAWGEPRDASHPGHVSQWVVGGPTTQPDLVVIVAADVADHAEREAAGLLGASAGALRLLRREDGAVLPGPLAGHEHFGFRDGVSQPALRGMASRNPYDFLSPRDPDAPGRTLDKRGADLVWPGEFILGYPRCSDDDPALPGAEAVADPPWARNGAFVVFRRYLQDVPVFQRYMRDTARRLANADPTLADLDERTLAERFLGRRFDGSALLDATPRDGEPQADWSAGRADLDPEGLACPHAAHVRKTHPRGSTVAGVRVHRHRILRRGIPFGPAGDEPAERGLLFLGYVASIERQFEATMRDWISNPDFAAPGAGVDPLLGAVDDGTAPRRPFALRLPTGGGGAKLVLERPPWTTPTAGGYFFAPSIDALQGLTRL